MSQPPPYGSPNETRINPDRRPLPPGWIQQYDSNYNAWFYVNTVATPPQTTWVHPLGPPPPQNAPASQFAPPPGPPPPNNANRDYPPASGYGYNNPQGQYSGYGGAPSGYAPGYGGSPPPPQGYVPPQPAYGGYQPAPYQEQGGKGLFGRFGHQQQPVYAQPPPQQVIYEQAPPKKSGIGMGGLIAAGGAGLLGGALLESAFDGGDGGGDGGDGGDWGGDGGGDGGDFGGDGGGDW